MPTVNEKLFSESVSHAIDSTRYSNGVVRRIIAMLNKSDADIFSQIVAALDKLPAGAFSVDRLDSLLSDVRRINAAAYLQIRHGLESELKDFVEYEAGYQYQLFQTALPVSVSVASVSVQHVYSAALSRPFQVSKDGAVPLNEYLSGLEAGRAAKIRDAIRLGYIESETTDQIIRRIRGTKVLNYADGLMDASRGHIEGMVRTALNHTANHTRQAFYSANSSLVKKWMFVATLDSRVSITCASLSGKTFPIGTGPQPPRHINCRSSSAPVLASWRELGINIDELPESTRSSMDGQMPENITFSNWLRGKSAAVQDDILGSTRGKLFRSGNIEVDRFANNKGKVYSIDQLRQRDAEMFAKAKL